MRQYLYKSSIFNCYLGENRWICYVCWSPQLLFESHLGSKKKQRCIQNRIVSGGVISRFLCTYLWGMLPMEKKTQKHHQMEKPFSEAFSTHWQLFGILSSVTDCPPFTHQCSGPLGWQSHNLDPLHQLLGHLGRAGTAPPAVWSWTHTYIVKFHMAVCVMSPVKG